VNEEVVLDGSAGEGGGQILRTALSLSLVTGRPFRISKVRAGREKPGLRPQHLAAVGAAARISSAAVEGATLGSQDLSFRPGPVTPGTYLFDVGTAGSTTLVLQTLLVPLALAGASSDVTIVGGTHNPAAPPFEFVERAFLPVIERMGPRVRIELQRPGFFPAGGGRIRAWIGSCGRLAPVEILERGDVVAKRARIVVARLPVHVADRERKVLVQRARMHPSDVSVLGTTDCDGAGNSVALEIACRGVTEVVSALGRKGLPAEGVAKEVADGAATWLETGVPVGAHLADQLLLPLAVAGGGAFRTVEPTAHTRTNAEVVARFLPVRIELRAEDRRCWRADVRPA
jgi:RNA 3'-terminal phosphate cyclase (ATP)